MAERTILVVDDEPHIRSLVRNILQREHYRVLEAGDGCQALSICDEQGAAIDLLLTDIVMPKLDGIQLAEQVVAAHPRIRVLYMSGKCDVETVQRQVREFGFGFIRKPFAIDALLGTVQHYLGAEVPKKGITRETPPAATSSAGA